MDVVFTLKSGTQVEAVVQCWLGDRFASFKATCDKHGVRPVKDAAGKWHNMLSLDSVPAFSDALRATGFKTGLDPQLSAQMVQRAESVRQDVSAAEQRADAVDASLRARGLALFQFQRYGVGWLAPRRRALLADQMGLGKTIQALVSLPDKARGVWVAPKATLTNVRAEVQRFRPDLSVTITARGQFHWPQESELVVTNYEALPDDAGTPPAGTYLMADEAHMLKTRPWSPKFKSGSKRTARWRTMADGVLANNGTVWVITGTPQLNLNPMELWNVLEAARCANDAFGSFAHYKRLFNAREGRYGLEWGEPSQDVATLLRRVMLARRRTEVLPDLPTKLYRNHVVDLDEISAQTVATLDDAMQAAVARGIDFAALDAEPQFEEYSKARAQLAVAKIPAMLELVETYEDENEPLVLFSAHRAPVDAMATRPGWRVITGDTPTEERGAIVAAFQAGDLAGVALTIAAGGVGLTLTRSHNVLFVDRAWTPALNEQAEDRCCRIGQDRGVNVVTMVVDHPVDSRVHALVLAKQQFLQQTVEAAAVSAPAASTEFADALQRTAADGVLVDNVLPVQPDAYRGTATNPTLHRRASQTAAEAHAAVEDGMKGE